MPTDLKLIDLAGARIIGATWPNPALVEGEYNLVQRVYMNLLTDPGDDQFDPEWGAGLRAALQGIPGQDDQQARQAVQRALLKCRDDVVDAMGQSPDPAERLVELSLGELEYDYERAAWTCSVTLLTELSSQIVVDIAVE